MAKRRNWYVEICAESQFYEGFRSKSNAEYYKKGTVHKLPKILANAADLTGFVGATEIEAVTTAVTTIPQNTKIKV